MTDSTKTCPNQSAADVGPAACTANPNAYYDPIKRKCICCNTNGTYYKTKQADGTNICATCNNTTTTLSGTTTSEQVPCGTNLYCKGPTINPDASCVQYVNKQWAAICPTPAAGTNVKCGGECYGACKWWAEWLAFMKCQQNSTTFEYECKPTTSQLKSWAFWTGILLIIVIIIAIFIWLRHSIFQNTDKVVVRASVPADKTSDVLSVPTTGHLLNN